MSLPALIGFAGVLVAAVATGVLAGRCARRPRIDSVIWTAAALALTAALAAQSMGFASGFGPATFRAVQLFGLMLAPLWLAWGLAELVWLSEAARFGARLAAGAVTVVGSVILATDPLTAQPFGKSWPLAGPHYQPPSHYVLDLVQALAVIVVAVSGGLAAARVRTDRQWLGALPGIAAVALAVLVTVGLRFAWPARPAYPLLAAMAVALVWFGATSFQDLLGRRSGPGPRRRTPPGPGRYPGGAGPAGAGPAGAGPVGPGRDGRAPPLQDAQPAQQPPRAAAAPACADTEFGAQPEPTGSQASAPARPYGRILIFTLLEDRVADFDRLAEQTAEQVRAAEPGTVVYVIHLVPNAPMQRIFYEIYRDRAAFDNHESRPYMKRFVAERRSCVLATNVIELRLKYAKVAPLPSSQPLARAAPDRAGWARRPPVLEPLPPAPDRRLPSAGRPDGGI